MRDFSDIFIDSAIAAVNLNKIGPMSNLSRTEVYEYIFETKLVDQLKNDFTQIKIHPSYDELFCPNDGLIGDVLVYKEQKPYVFLELKVLDEKYHSGARFLADIYKIYRHIDYIIDSNIECYVGALVTDLEKIEFNERLDRIEREGRVKFRRGAPQPSFDGRWKWSAACARITK